MSLRRPPTRVELKADDIIEYEEIMREREIAAADAAAKAGASGGGGGGGSGVNDSAFSSKPGGGGATGATPSTGAKRKATIAERIGAPR
eukprot:CAMPEP_0197715820 /NCGR_PEP_ID=MMETSP1434-20131217/912_1 /TAXON_ID=265543 /ORGANISM="Minutocellus polymorphus, Strain CCMP3303" /LENGTH=88 /DNA_ID=CAMNT_0043300055 /DNA_START=51 /DNA_END=317 /DNA_ORIENTATION=+